MPLDLDLLMASTVPRCPLSSEAAPLAAPPPAPKGPVEEKSLDVAAFFWGRFGTLR